MTTGSKIIAGLQDAVALARGDASSAREEALRFLRDLEPSEAIEAIIQAIVLQFESNRRAIQKLPKVKRVAAARELLLHLDVSVEALEARDG